MLPLHAQREPVAFRHLTIADGLSQNAVYAILQDRRGLMWLGTKDGLNRYDGYDFTVFRHDPFDPASMSGSDVTVIFEDDRGRLWIGYRDGGLDRFDRTRKRFHRYADAPPEPITAIAEDPEGSLWIGTDGGGLYRLSADQAGNTRGTFDRFPHDPGDPRSLADDRVHDVLVDRRGTVWVGTETGLSRLDASSSSAARFRRYAPGPPAAGGLIDPTVGSLLEDSKGRLWIGGKSGLAVLDPRRERIAHHPHGYRTDTGGWGEAIDLLEDRDGRIWMSTFTGLARFDPDADTFERLRPDRMDPSSVSAGVPTALLQDRSGVVWVGTNGYGINLHDPKARRFHTVRGPRNRDDAAPTFSVYTLFEDAAGTVWIGAGSLYRWDRETGEFGRLDGGPRGTDGFDTSHTTSIIESPTGVLWIGTLEGMYRYEIASGRTRRYAHDPDDPDGLPGPEVFDVFEDDEGRLWVVTRNYLARLVDPSRGRFRSHPIHDPPVRDRWVYPSTLQDSRGRLWLGSNQGLLRFDPGTGYFRRYRHDPDDPASLGYDVIRSLHLDPREPDRHLWVGTAGGGLARFDFERERFEHYTVDDGLPNNVVYGILADDSDDLWLSTNRGLSRFDPRNGTFRNYDAEDGLQSDEFNSGAAFRSESGELFFGGIEGFNHFHPDEIEDNPHVPPVVITGFKRGNRYESVADTASVLTKAISETDSLELSHRDDALTFEFAALDFSMPSKNRYAYRLVGHNDEWIESGAVRSVTFTNLPPGSYVFEVRGSNNDGVWNETGTSLAIAIAPPWWRTGWAYAIYGLLFLAALYAARRYEMRRVRLENRLEVERVEAEQLRELDRSRSRFFANVSHEFRTPLTLTLGPLDDLRAGIHGPLPAAVTEQVDLARRNARRVLDLIEQMLDVARLEAGRTPLRARLLDLGALVEETGRAFAPMVERKSLAFEVRVPDRPVEVYGDPEHLEKAVSNLLSNAVKFTPEGGAVRIAVEGDEEVARVTVRDSGPGIAEDELERVFDRFHRVDDPSREIQPGTGIGLALVRELVELHGGTVSARSELGFGSAFTITLRRGRDHLAPAQIADEDAPARGPGPAPVGVETPAAVPEPAGSLSSGSDEPAAVAPGGLDVEEDPDADVTTVLVVEDNAEVRAYVRTHLSPRYRVLEATDGREALEIVRRRLPDLVLSDVMMPGMDGYALCRAIKEDPATDFIPVVLLTARAAPEDRVAGLEEMADDYLTKPFDVRELLARVENLIASRARLLERFGGGGPELHPAEVDVEPRDQRFLDEVREAIERNLGDETFTVERLAEEVAHSRGHLYRRLRALVDEAPSDVIRRMRLERAAALVAGDAGSISEIAYSVGFKSVSHFSNCFQEHFGVRPSLYRAEHVK
ncbi:MAG: two-component regulator propeller domain-containing protein [Gemmatimonadota bacterium]|nr:two-component regulator propeller domain-containing protein [Gemmatimonadota bacterium]